MDSAVVVVSGVSSRCRYGRFSVEARAFVSVFFLRQKSKRPNSPNYCGIVQSISTTVYAGGGVWLNRCTVVVVGNRQEFARG